MSDVPPVSRLLAHPYTERLFVRFDRDQVAQACRDITEELLRAAAVGRTLDPAVLLAETILAKVDARLGGLSEAGIQRVVNATGVVLHAGLGRALLPHSAVQAMRQAATQAVNIDYDLAQGDAGRRDQSVADLLTELTGSEAALMVTSTEAASLLAVRTLAAGRNVVVAARDLRGRGHDTLAGILEASGASVVRIGTDTSARIEDYANAIDDRAAVVLRVHSPERETPRETTDDETRELVRLGHERHVPVIEILDGGALIDLGTYGLAAEPVVSARLALGLDAVIFEADAAVGGAHAGLLAGRSDLVSLMSRSPLYAALRCGKLTVAALEGTLRLYREAADVVHEVPALRALTRPLADIEDTARRALPALTSALGVGFRVMLRDSVSRVRDEPRSGTLPTTAIAIEHDYMGAHRIAGRFRQARPPIIGRVEDDWFLLDARAVFDPLDLVPNWADELEEPARYPL